MASRQTSLTDTDGLEAYFTDVEHLQELFCQALVAPALVKRLLVIHGVGGVGKSSLLRMFRLRCKSARVPVALALGDEAKSAVDVLSDWADDVKAQGMPLPTFAKTFDHYRGIQAQVERQMRKAQGARGSATNLAGKAAAKVAETVTGAAVGALVGSAIPGIGPLAGTLGGMGAEALVDWLHGFLPKSDIDLLLDPTKKLTGDFLGDVSRVAPKQRLVLILDTFEQMATLDGWMYGLAQQLHQNVLLVIAGRAVPDWSRRWPGWLAQSQIEELKPMTEEVMRALVHRYYATMHGGEPDPKQVEAIIRFARGLPLVVTTAVRLWMQYGVEDFQAVKPQVMADLVDRLMEGVPQELRPALEAAAAVRWFNKDILREVMGQADVNALYSELRRFPFVRPRAEGLALHEAVLEIVDENLRVHDPKRHRELHERAAAYLEGQLMRAAGEEAERLGLERLYQRIRADEQAGIRLFQEMAEELVRYRLVNRLQALLKDADSCTLDRENSRLWREYYHACLAHLEARLADAEKAYQAISESNSAEPKLRAYALCDWGQILTRNERLEQPGGIEKANSILEQSFNLAPLDFHIARGFFSLARIPASQAKWDEEFSILTRAKEFFEQQGDDFGLAYVYIEMKRRFGRRGLWKDLFAVQKQLEDVSRRLPESAVLASNILGRWAWGWALAGRLSESERRLRDSLRPIRVMGDPDPLLNVLRDLGWALGYQGQYNEADQCFSESLKIAQSLGKDYMSRVGYVYGFWGAVLARQSEADKASEYLLKSLESREAMGKLEALVGLGKLHEIRQHWDKAQDYYNRCLDQQWRERYYFFTEALAGLVRVKHRQGDYAALLPLLTKAEQLAHQYEYNDHLASLRLTQGHIAWGGHLPEGWNGFDAALHFYQHALIYALRYNRFLLDEVLWGGGIATPLCSILPHCVERGEEGRGMLVALRDWWRMGANDIGTPRLDTISPIAEGIPLVEAERMAREREPGDGRPQNTSVEQIDAALATAWAKSKT